MANTLPIDTNKNYELIGREFYLAVVGYDAKKRISEPMQQLGSVRKLRRGFHDLVTRLRGKEISRFEDYEGSMIEVTDRQPHQLGGYMWPTVDSITYENGDPVGKSIPSSEVFRSYLFTPDTISLYSNGCFSMSGQAREYCLHENAVGNPLEQRVTVHYKKVPTKKSNGGAKIACL